MDLLRTQFARIQQQLAGLTASQRMLAGALVVIMVMTLFYWAQYAGKAELQPVLDQAFSAQQITRVRTQLAAMGISYQVSGDRVLVPADRRSEVLAALSYEQMLPEDTASGFDVIVKQLSPWDPASKTDVMWNQAKQITLSQIIRRWPGVTDASVIIDAHERRSFTSPVAPRATINIRTAAQGRPDKKLISAAADLVRGAQAGLDRGQITVIVNGVSHPMSDGGLNSISGANDLLELRQQNEAYYAQKISDHLAWIQGGVFVSVAVDVSGRQMEEQRTAFDPKTSVQKESRITAKTDESNSGQAPGGEPGAGANISASFDDEAPREKTSTTSTQEETEFSVGLGQTQTTSREGPGRATVLAATVRIPRSYFVRVYRAMNPSSQGEITEASLRPLIDDELLKVRKDVKACIGLTDDGTVTVETYADAGAFPTDGGAAAQPSMVDGLLGGEGIAGAVTGHAKELAVGLLAVVSLFMMSMMVRKSAPAAPPAPVVIEPPGPLSAGEGLAGEAAEGEAALDAVELDDEAIRSQQMLGQVATMVKENPDAAAALVKRWLNK